MYSGNKVLKKNHPMLNAHVCITLKSLWSPNCLKLFMTFCVTHAYSPSSIFFYLMEDPYKKNLKKSWDQEKHLFKSTCGALWGLVPILRGKQ